MSGKLERSVRLRRVLWAGRALTPAYGNKPGAGFATPASVFHARAILPRLRRRASDDAATLNGST